MDRLGYVILYVSDITASIAFYRDVVGVSFKFEDAGYAEFATRETRLALYEARRAAWLTGRAVTPGPAAEIVFMVSDADAQTRRWRTWACPSSAGRPIGPGVTAPCRSATRMGSSWSSRRRFRAAAHDGLGT